MKAKATRLRDRIRSLRTRHAELSNRIKDETSRPLPDGLRVQTLKRMRLKAKDQITLILGELRTRRGPQTPSAA